MSSDVIRRHVSGMVNAMRSDGYANVLSGLGVGSQGNYGPSGSRADANRFMPNCVLRSWELRGLYDHNWLARRIVDTLPDQALRRPIVVKPGAQDAFNKVNISNRYPQGAFKHGLKMGRLCGGAAIVIGSVNSGAGLAEPLPEGVGEVAFLEVVTKFDLSSRVRYEPNDPDPLKRNKTEIFEVRQGRLRGLYIHESRLIVCEGDTRASFYYDQENIDFPWQSVLQNVNEVLGSYGISWVSTGHLIQESSMAWLKLRGLADMLTTEDQTEVNARQQLLSTGRNVARTIFLDAGDSDSNGEEFGRTAVSFSDLPALLQELRHEVAGASGIPEPILFKQSMASEIGGSGETDMRQFYDGVAEYRLNNVKPKFDQLLTVTKCQTDYAFPSLWEPTDTQAADIRVKQTGGDQQLYTMNVLTAAQILKSRAEDGTLGIKIEDLDAAVKALEEKEAKDAELTNAERLAGTQPAASAEDGPKQATATSGLNAGSVGARPGPNNIPPNS